MKDILWLRFKIVRLLITAVAVLIYVCLLVLDAYHFFDQLNPLASWVPLASFGFSAFVALMFLAVGSLVWLYARDRGLALLLFGFSTCMMITFAVETASNLNDSTLSDIGGLCSVISLFLFSIFLLRFPKNHLSQVSRNAPTFFTGKSIFYVDINPLVLIYLYIGILVVLGTISFVYCLMYFIHYLPLIDGLVSIDYLYNIIAIVGSIITMIVTYFKLSALRERQQYRLFVYGVIVAITPLLLLTILPTILGLSQYVIDAQISTITVILLPLAFGYTILRYQVLVFDMYIRRAVAWMVGIVGLAMVAYVMVVVGSILLPKSGANIFIAISLVILGPCVWSLAKMVTERLFFSEMLHYERIINQPDMLESETFDLNEAAQILTMAAIQAFEMQEVCLFVLDSETGTYQLAPTLKESDPQYAVRQQLAQRLLQSEQSLEQSDTITLSSQELVVQRLMNARRPLLLAEATTPEEELPGGLRRYITTSAPLHSTDPLLAPIRAHGKMIGILMLGERADHQQYAGPDFEAVHLLLSRFSSVLETARLYAEASRHVTILNTLYSANAMPVQDFETVEDAASAYTIVAADAAAAGARIWLYQKSEQMLCRVAQEGQGPFITHENTIAISQEQDWQPYFYEGEALSLHKSPSMECPSCVNPPIFPFAWLPLTRAQEHLGVLVLTYPRPHRFSQEEKHVLKMFARQCAVALENVRIAIELRAAYEKQKELDRMKDQFIVTASHELRTPLTAVQGYIELLNEYRDILTPDARSEFISKAQRGCDELTLMVGNIMDASRVQIDAENVRLVSVPLLESVHHVLEILEAMTRREGRFILLDVSEDVQVMADNIRLRQVLLNLVSNALKYSPARTSIEITSTLQEDMVIVSIRDYGAGVPLEEQDRLFERFVRLERDMNSPTRGAGLGLYISKQLVEAMGGRIWVESTGIPGEGSTFAFALKRSMVSSSLRSRSLQPQEV